MKTLGKISFEECREQSLLDREAMRTIRGGADDDEYEWFTQGGTCGLNMWKDGVRVKAIRGVTKEWALEQFDAFQHDADANTMYDKVYWCCDNCD